MIGIREEAPDSLQEMLDRLEEMVTEVKQISLVAICFKVLEMQWGTTMSDEQRGQLAWLKKKFRADIASLQAECDKIFELGKKSECPEPAHN